MFNERTFGPLLHLFNVSFVDRRTVCLVLFVNEMGLFTRIFQNEVDEPLVFEVVVQFYNIGMVQFPLNFDFSLEVVDSEGLKDLLLADLLNLNGFFLTSFIA